MPSNILVTGGAGYIGSHTVRQLCDAGAGVVVIDNLYSGHQWAVDPRATFYHCDIADTGRVAEILAQHRVDAVVHFAGHIVVPESVADPAKYYRNNVVGSLSLIDTCIAAGVGQFVFSSSAAVYGIPHQVPVDEASGLHPINPYGTTKLMTEWTLRDLAAATGDAFRFVALRYFNVAGACMGGGLGQATPEATHLIKVACEAACGKREGMAIYGDDYDTPDGTCIRDYIHVDDLAAAHLDALAYLDQGGASDVFNCGYGRGYSVREVVACVKAASGVDFPVSTGPRRAGDPPQLVADNHKIVREFGWQPKYNDIEIICASAWRWETSYRAERA